MRLLLKDFQVNAVDQVVRHLRRAAREAIEGDPQAVSLSAPTGSGKTIMATAAIERLIAGDDDAAPHPNATFLWITDQPELNEQTRRKMLLGSSLLDPSNLIVLDPTFDAEVLDAGDVYFLNTQKLGRNAGLVKPGDRSYTIWETINNTVSARPGSFFVFIDEAHRGMSENPRARNEATTIIQKFIKGSPGELPAIPLIAGISATVERFQRLIEGTSRTSRSFDVDPVDVRESGLLKEVIILYHPTEEQPSDITLLRAAGRAWRDMGSKWKAYCTEQNIDLVAPILVVQVEDGSGQSLSRTDLAEVIAALDSEIGPLPERALAHAFQEGAPRQFGGRNVRYLAPSDIDTDPDVQVVFFKTSLNTGWDCPRAEAMMSFRRALDATSIAQLVGRMVRTPLARSVESDQQLNSVPLYLPHYDEAGLARVIDILTGADIGPVRVERGENLVSLHPAEGSEKAFDALTQLPSYVVPKRGTSNQVRRLMKLARLLSNDALDRDAPEKATAALVAVLDTAYSRLVKTETFKKIVEENGTIKVDAVSWRLGEAMETAATTFELAVSDENVNDLFDVAGRMIAEGIHKAWWRARIAEKGVSPEQAKLEIFALASIASVVSELQSRAQVLTQEWLNKRASAIRSLSEASRAMYAEVQRLASDPEIVPLTFPSDSINISRGATSWSGHIYVNGSGKAPLALNGWETQVIESEMERPDFRFWLRNFDRKTWSLTVPYEKDGRWAPLYPDFLVVREEDDGTLVVDLLDPHTISLADAPAKAAGLAKYAAKHAPEFGRIELIIVKDGQLRRLDLKDETVRNRVASVQHHSHLLQLFDDAS
jgi:type III restriction enzyme